MSRFELERSANSCAEYICSFPMVRTIMDNPIYTSLLITALACVIFMSIYYKSVKKLGNKYAIRSAIYLFLVILATTFLHRYVVIDSCRISNKQKDIHGVFSGIELSRESSTSSTKVTPNISNNPSVNDVHNISGGSKDISMPEPELNIMDVIIPTKLSK